MFYKNTLANSYRLPYTGKGKKELSKGAFCLDSRAVKGGNRINQGEKGERCPNGNTLFYPEARRCAL